jgi:hypothetical protein
MPYIILSNIFEFNSFPIKYSSQPRTPIYLTYECNLLLVIEVMLFLSLLLLFKLIELNSHLFVYLLPFIKHLGVV